MGQSTAMYTFNLVDPTRQAAHRCKSKCGDHQQRPRQVSGQARQPLPAAHVLHQNGGVQREARQRARRLLLQSLAHIVARRRDNSDGDGQPLPAHLGATARCRHPRGRLMSLFWRDQPLGAHPACRHPNNSDHRLKLQGLFHGAATMPARTLANFFNDGTASASDS